MGPVASPDNTIRRYFYPVLSDFVNVLKITLPGIHAIQIRSRKLHPGSALTQQSFDYCRGRVIKAGGGRQPPQMIEDNLHWKPIKQGFMRDDLVCGPMKLQMPAELIYAGRQWFNHVKRGWRMLWRIESKTDTANTLVVEQPKC